MALAILLVGLFIGRSVALPLGMLAKAAKQVAAAAHEASRTAQEGGQAMEWVREEMARIDATTREAAEAMEELSRRSAAIGHIRANP